MTAKLVPGPGGEKVLIVEDDRSLREGLALNLKASGYSVVTAADGNQGLRAAFDEAPDLIILDIMLPGLSGLEILAELRRNQSQTHVLILSARDQLPDKLEGFGLGADDYVTKPFDLRELLARIDARLRRKRILARDQQTLRFGDVVVDFQARTITRKGEDVATTPREFDLLALLVRNPRKAYSREQILREVWGYQYEGTTRTVDNFVLSLRQKIEDDPQAPRYLATVRTVGYRFDP
ncbi:MAG: response regulator transcription factor [Deltaproteobacteria bacterium]|nr:response regulator transcription factor [Deltaproteobacteria bacterium]